VGIQQHLLVAEAAAAVAAWTTECRAQSYLLRQKREGFWQAKCMLNICLEWDK